MGRRGDQRRPRSGPGRVPRTGLGGLSGASSRYARRRSQHLRGARLVDGIGSFPSGGRIDFELGQWCFETTTPLTEGTYEAARSTVDVALTATLRARRRSRRLRAVSAARPPAPTALYGGYCFFNNAAIAAQHVARPRARKVACSTSTTTTATAPSRSSTTAATSCTSRSTAIRRARTRTSSGYADETGSGRGRGHQPQPAARRGHR